MFALTGKTIGPYRILEQIGHGGMAMVYKAYQPSMDRYVAIKVLSPNLSQDAEFVKRFQREARAIAKLEHGHILPVHDYGEHEGVAYITMRYVEAGTLRDRITAGQLSLSEINRIIGQIGGALEYAHRMGVVHRDVKPGNVLLNDQGETYLTDFGLARMMEPIERLTASGVGLGTPAYMSPEQGRGDKVDDRSDIYSLGVILYEMVTGRVPFEAETPMAIVLKHINEPLSLPHTIKPDVPELIERVILKAMAKDPADRFQTAGEMVQALAIATRTVNAEPDREFIPVNVPMPARDDVSLVTRIQQTWAQPRGKVMLAGGGLAVIVVLGFLLTWLLPNPIAIVGQAQTATSTPPLPTLPAQVPTQTLAAPATADTIDTFNPPALGEQLKICVTGTDLCIVDGEGKDTSLGLSEEYANFRGFGFLPDGSQIVFASCSLTELQQDPDYEFCHDIFIMGRDGSEVTPLIHSANIVDTDPSWSPDGEWIAVGGWSLSIIRPDGTGLAKLVSGDAVGNIAASAWSPDSQRLAFVSGAYNQELPWGYLNNVSVINREGGGWRTIFSLPNPKPASEDWITETAWSPDGQSVAIQFGDGRAYLIDADCEAGASGCQLSDITQIPEIPQEWLDTFHPQRGSAVLYEEDFEDGILQDAVLTSEITRWQIVKDETGNMVHRIDNRDGPNFAWMEFGSEEWKDYAVEFRMRILTPESDRWGVVMHFRNDTIGNSYILDISPEIPSSGVVQLAMTLNNNPWVVFKSENTENTADVWHTVRQEVDQDQIRTYFDERLVIDVTDSQIQQGHVVLGAGPGAYVEFDDIRMISLGTTTASTLAPQAEQARAFAEPILAAIADRPPDFEYDFSKLTSGWDTGSNQDSARDYVDGEYVVTVKPNHGTGAGPGKSFVFSDFVAEVDARIVSATDSGGWGFIFREQSTSPTSRYHINFDKSGLVIFLAAETSTDLFNLQGMPVRPAPETNHLLVIAKGPNIAIYVNDEPVTVVNDTTLSNGIVSLGIHAGDQETEVHFDNFKVWDISDLPDSTLTSQAEQARAFAEPILQAISDKAPNFEDDFSTGGPGWTWDDRMAGQVEITDGVMRVNGMGGHGIFPPNNQLNSKNFVYEFDARLLDPRATLGTFFRQQNADIWYGFMIHGNDNSWHINISVEAQPPTAMGFTNVLPQGQINRIRIIARENRFAIYLNGKPTAYFEDATFPETGSLMPTFKSESEEPVQGEFDNFKFWDISKLP